MYFLGACIGSIACGLYQYTWPARLTNVRQFLLIKVLFGLLSLKCLIHIIIFYSLLKQYVIGAILFVSCGFMFWNNALAFSIARFLAGFSYGFIYITIITQIADNVIKTVRGYMAVLLAQYTLLGLLLGVGFSENSFKKLSYMRWIFLFISLGFPIVSVIMTRYLTYEPVTRLLKMELEIEAQHVLTESRNNKIEDSVIQYEIEERKLMLFEDYDDLNQCCGLQKVFSRGNGMTLLWIVLLRLLHILTSNMFLFILSAISIYPDLNYVMHMMIIFIRILVLNIPQYSIDKLGRKSLLLTSGIGSGILLIPFAIKQMNFIQIRGDLFVIITFGIHVFAAFGIEAVQPIYAAEAFPLSQRNGSLAIVSCFEFFSQGIIAILLLLGTEIPLKILLMATPFIVSFLTIILFVTLPETKSMPLRRCRYQFNKKIVKKTLPLRISRIHTIGSIYM